MGKRKIKRKIIGIMVGMMAFSSVTAFAATQMDSKVINFQDVRVSAFLNVYDKFEGAARTRLDSATPKQNLIVGLYLKSKGGATLKSAQDMSSPKNVYVSFYKQGNQTDPARVWQSQHSTKGTSDPYHYLTLFID